MEVKTNNVALMRGDVDVVIHCLEENPKKVILTNALVVVVVVVLAVVLLVVVVGVVVLQERIQDIF